MKTVLRPCTTRSKQKLLFSALKQNKLNRFHKKKRVFGRILNSVHNIIRACISRFLLLRFFFFFFDFPVSFLFFSRKLLEKVSENYFFQVPSRQHFLSVQRLPDYSMTRKIDKDKNIYILF